MSVRKISDAMKLNSLIEIAKVLPVGSEKTIYKENDIDFILRRPEKQGRTLKREYNVERNLQIWIREGNHEFMPNHLRILLDLEFKLRFYPEYKKHLMTAFDRLYYGEDPDSIAEDFKHLKFRKELRDLKYDLYLAQLFFAEQEVGYHFKAKVNPKYLYLQGWIRCVLSREMEIDKVLWSATRNPPPAKFTKKDNRNHKKYDPDAKPLWWVPNNQKSLKSF